MIRHWADERPSEPLRLPIGTCVLMEQGSDEEGMVFYLKPITDQPSAREELARALEDAAARVRG
jgi:hypothetical protein